MLEFRITGVGSVLTMPDVSGRGSVTWLGREVTILGSKYKVRAITQHWDKTVVDLEAGGWLEEDPFIPSIKAQMDWLISRVDMLEKEINKK